MAKQTTKTVEPPPPTASVLVDENSQEALRFAGAGFLSDLAKMAFAEGKTMTLSAEDAAASGAGFVQDMCKQVVNGDGGVTPPATDPPVLTTIDPSTAVLGSADLVLHCYGSGFTSATIIVFADQDEPTTLVSANEVTTGVKPSLGWGAVEVPVLVKNGDLTSTAFAFTFTDAAANVSANR